MTTNYRGWMFIGFTKEYRKGKIEARKFMSEDCLVFRTDSGKLNMVEAYCSHFGANMQTGKVVKDSIQCPMHGRKFNGDGTGCNSKHRPIRSYPISENRGLTFAYFDHAGVEPKWEAPVFLDEEEFPDILWKHSRMLSLHHPSVPLDNAVDPRHFEFTHKMFGKHAADGVFKSDGHKALGTMSVQLTAPLSWVTAKQSNVITHFDSPLNTSLKADMGVRATDLCNLVTIIDGKECLLTQFGIGHRSLNPLKIFENLVSLFGSWNATREDAPIWNDRKVQEPDNYPHETDKSLVEFREWFEGFAYDPDEPESPIKMVVNN